MKLTRKKFENLLQKNKLVLSLIGMSNAGKTRWSQKLSSIGFKHFNCDDLIEEKLSPFLKKYGYRGIKDVARWMGYPYEKKSFKNQKRFLNFETQVLKDIFKKLKNVRENTVIDTTGSIVHLDKYICKTLKKKTMVVYIKVTNSMRAKMFERYMENPKPVVFGDVFSQKKGETEIEALKRCYPKLINKRSKLYAKYADITIPKKILKRSMQAKVFLSFVNKGLK